VSPRLEETREPVAAARHPEAELVHLARSVAVASIAHKRISAMQPRRDGDVEEGGSCAFD